MKQIIAPRLKYTHYQLVSDILFRINYNGIHLTCPDKQDVDKVLKELHDGPTRGHFTRETKTHKILRVGYY
jgi:hypothetical protein